MTICLTCNRYFMDADTCTAEAIKFPGGTVLEAVPFGQESNADGVDRCPECGVDTGGFHHPGCAIAACPRCQDPLVSCGCLDEP